MAPCGPARRRRLEKPKPCPGPQCPRPLAGALSSQGPQRSSHGFLLETIEGSSCPLDTSSCTFSTFLLNLARPGHRHLKKKKKNLVFEIKKKKNHSLPFFDSFPVVFPWPNGNLTGFVAKEARPPLRRGRVQRGERCFCSGGGKR